MQIVKFIKIILFVIICNLTQTVYSQYKDTIYLKIEIEQNVLPGPNPIFKYEIQNRNLNIYQINTRCIDTVIVEKSKKIYSKTLNAEQLDTLEKLSGKVINSNLDSNYSIAMLDGVNWNFKITYKKIQQKIYLDNCKILLLDNLLAYINRQLPIKSRMISFDRFNVKTK